MKTVMRNSRVIDVQSCDDWTLILVINWYGAANSLPIPIQQELMNLTWKIQDGYGEPGRTPTQGWDWSGIRDSSEEAQAEMAKAIREYLEKKGYRQFEAWALPGYCLS